MVKSRLDKKQKGNKN